MSNFGAKLVEIMERRDLTAAEISRNCGVSQPLISKWVNGQQSFVSADDLRQISNYITNQPSERAELVRAHVLDEIMVPGGELLSITILGKPTIKHEEHAYWAALPLKLQRALEVLGKEAVGDVDVRAVLLSLANLCAPELLSSAPVLEDVDNPDKLKSVVFPPGFLAPQSVAKPPATDRAKGSVERTKVRRSSARSPLPVPVSHTKKQA